MKRSSLVTDHVGTGSGLLCMLCYKFPATTDSNSLIQHVAGACLVYMEVCCYHAMQMLRWEGVICIGVKSVARRSRVSRLVAHMLPMSDS